MKLEQPSSRFRGRGDSWLRGTAIMKKSGLVYSTFGFRILAFAVWLPRNRARLQSKTDPQITQTAQMFLWRPEVHVKCSTTLLSKIRGIGIICERTLRLMLPRDALRRPDT